MLAREYSVLWHVSSEIRAWRSIMARFAKHMAPDFNLFDFTPTNELSLSKVIGWLLDPTGTHAQGRVFLNRLLDRCGIEHAPRSGDAVIELEGQTDEIDWSTRRIDIRVTMDGFVLGIENKPYAGWQERQLGDYLDDLRTRSPSGHCLLVLKGWSGLAPELVYGVADAAAAEALRECGGIIDADYYLVSEWLRDCAKDCRAERVRLVVEDLADYVERAFLGISNMGEIDHLMEGIASDPLLLEPALSLIAAKDVLLKHLTRILIQNVGQRAVKSGWKMDGDPKLLLDPARGKTGLHFQLNPDADWTVSVEFWKPGLTTGYVGIRMKKPTSAARRRFTALCKAMATNDKNMESEEPEDQWPYWVHLEYSGIKVFEKDDPKELWAALPTEKFADEIILLVGRIKTGLSASGLY